MKRTKDNLIENLHSLIGERFKLQTTQRYLVANNLPQDVTYLKTEQFKQKYDSWPQWKKKNFLETVAGKYWKQMKKEIEG